MSFSVICPACKEVNPGHVYHCIKCNANLIGVPRQEDPLTEAEIAARQKNVVKNQNTSFEKSKVESVGHTIRRFFKNTLITVLIIALLAVLVCWLLGGHTLSDFAISIAFAGILLIISGVLVFIGNLSFVQSQKNPLNPMNVAMPGLHSENARQHWLNYMESFDTVIFIEFVGVLCICLGLLIFAFLHQSV